MGVSPVRMRGLVVDMGVPCRECRGCVKVHDKVTR